MTYTTLIILVSLIIIIIWSIEILTYYKIKNNDIMYFKKFLNKNLLSKLLNNNKTLVPKLTKNKILIITFDNRTNLKYIKLHNKNINEYVNIWGYKYSFINECNYNTYWCKIHLVLQALEQNLPNAYDYVIWMDSDTIIKNFNIDVGNIINQYSSDIYIGSDNNNKYGLVNSGVFIIKNSIIGKQFLKDCINYQSNICINNDNSLNGYWAASCYEQGVMNLLIADKYYNNTTILPTNIIFNFNVCVTNVFIMHLYASSNKYRVKCFT